MEKNIDMNSARVELTPSNPNSGVVTIWPYYQRSFLFSFRGARQTRDHVARITQHAPHSKRGGEAVMTDDGSQPPIEQLAKAIHRRSGTRSWCGPLLLVCAARRGCNVVGVLCVLSGV